LYRCDKARQLRDLSQSLSQASGSPPTDHEGGIWFKYIGGINALALASSQGRLSSVISELWKSESNEVRQKYHFLAEARRLSHKQEWPDYKYSPQRRQRRQRKGIKSPCVGKPRPLQRQTTNTDFSSTESVTSDGQSLTSDSQSSQTDEDESPQPPDTLEHSLSSFDSLAASEWFFGTNAPELDVASLQRNINFIGTDGMFLDNIWPNELNDENQSSIHDPPPPPPPPPFLWPSCDLIEPAISPQHWPSCLPLPAHPDLILHLEPVTEEM
jgi:hypothetical protein